MCGLCLDSLTSAEGLDLSGVNICRELNLRGLISAEGLNLSETSIDGYLDLSGLKNAKGLILPYNFNLDNLRCNDRIKKKIMNHPDKYFAMPPTEEENMTVHRTR